MKVKDIAPLLKYVDYLQVEYPNKPHKRYTIGDCTLGVIELDDIVDQFGERTLDYFETQIDYAPWGGYEIPVLVLYLKEAKE